MEVAQELRVILQDDENDVHRGCVETSHRRGGLLTWDQVLLYEREAAHQQVFDLFVLLLRNKLRLGDTLRVVALLIILSWRLCLILLCILVELEGLGWLRFDEVRHEELMRDQFEPCEGEGRIVVGVELLQEVSHVEEDLPLDLLIEALTHLCHGTKDVHEESIVRLLVENILLRVVVSIKLLLNELKYLGHELQFIELVKGCEKDEKQLRQAINEAVVESVVIEATLPRPCAQSELYAFFDHHIAECEEELLVFVDAQLA